MGIPYFYGASNAGSVTAAGSSDLATIANITHVRFTLNGRTVDLPCPSQIWNSPDTPSATNASQPASVGVANFQQNTFGSIVYDPWSNAHPTGTDPTSGGALQGIPSGFTPIGNFYYAFDYLAWIFGGNMWGNGFCPVSAPSTAGTAPNLNYYYSPSGYAVPQVTETTLEPQYGAVLATGWFNGLPVMARYQAQKVAAEAVYLYYQNQVNIIYRYLDGRIDDTSNSEEGINWGHAGPSDPNPAQSVLWNDVTVANRKYLRRLTSDATTGLASNATSLQAMAPSGWSQVYSSTPSSYDNLNDFIEATGNNVGCNSAGSLDPRTPQPWAYGLANTYYRTNVEPGKHDMTDIFPATSATCPSQNYVIIFPTGGFTDSTSTGAPTSILEDAATAYGGKKGAIPSGNGGGVPEIGGSFPFTSGSPGVPTTTGPLTPGDISFHPANLASVAAFATGSANSYQWASPWEVNPSTARSSKNPGLETMVMSVGIPGSVYCGSSHNLRSAAAQFFRIAQWSDPTRTDLGYAQWNPDKPGNDTSIVDPSNPGKVKYYPSGSPSQLQQNFGNAVSIVVQGSAALSAPATPSTGAQTTDEAFFGIFKTSQAPVWSGNFFAVGILDSLNTTTNEENISFYDASGVNTVACYTPTDNLNNPILQANGQPEVICGTNDFDQHHLWSAFDIFGVYLASDYSSGFRPQTAGVAGSPLLWSSRNVYTSDASNNLVSFKSSNTTLVSSLVTQFTSAALFPSSDSSSTLKTNHVKSFINFILGCHRTNASYNRIDIFGDVINSSPLTIELGSGNLGNLPAAIAWPATGTAPHVRLVLVGTNMGQLHCFVEASSLNANGYVNALATEAWAYIPPDVINTLFTVYLNDGIANSLPHYYTVDGSPTLSWTDVPPSGSPIGNGRVDSTEDAIVVFGLRKGGRSYTALQLSGSSGHPGLPVCLWRLDPQSPPSSPAAFSALVGRMGASTGTPVFASTSTDGTMATARNTCFLTGGYANNEINARYRSKGTISSSQGMGQSIIALDAKAGTPLQYWDFSSTASGATAVGAIPGSVAPLGIFAGYPLIQRIYFADMKGNVGVLDSTAMGANNSGFRLDTSVMSAWRTTPRFIYSNSAFRFSTAPWVYLLPSGFPVAVARLGTPTPANPNYQPMTAMVSVGSGDWNNPLDKDESVASLSLVSHPPASNRMYVFTDRQDSANLNIDSSGIPDADLQTILDKSLPTTAGTPWATSYSDPRVQSYSGQYFLGNPPQASLGYYYQLLDGSFPASYNGVTHDKVLVSPLVSDGAIFFSLFDVQGNGGFLCAANDFTRTFRECDILRPLAITSQTAANPADMVGDTNTLTQGLNSCNGLAFYFNSLASQMANTGNRVVQGGAITAASSQSFSQQTGSNTATLETVKDTPTQPGLKLRAWRVVH